MNTIVRRWKNKITAIKGDDGEWINEKSEIQNHIVSYFSKLFTEEGNSDLFSIPQDVFTELSTSDWTHLSKVYTKPEVELVVKQMGSLKAPGPDGFQALFFQKKTGSS